ncbi:decaprenylphospho-beta-D-erythro-pentofuranosid-2-ulose 2-reductase [Microlunatus sp. Gsoil 973]|uniref:decaprenylphospho-beta-D-erythro-pentofuranosid- 2-ulose 2-reductase n=1 Tax=Microlunatus sp. Gsoil 973 TaxID=2672569 RepID=UPI0012B4C600|nr:decaprenylphospho-beta-D-erythro-pentofuranosid-2-ulose 2-reductase [Microlunatus sp. Gsoil 973]QGN35206.1 decaprenylphospho-beta-D-erythro-pentofuranosid-2-ulose 2-reductase [Microlunatus sp. Gsoil 973]
MIDALGVPQSLLLLGGTSDIALAIARTYAAKRPELRVLLAARPGDRRTAAADELREAGCAVTELNFEATDAASRTQVVQQAFESADVDCVVVAFGILGDAEEAWTDPDAALRMAEINYTAPVHLGALVAERFRGQGYGQLIALSSVAGERVRRSNFVYGSTKAGFDGFYSGLGEALKPFGGRVLVVRPGFVRSKMTSGMDEAPMAVTPEQVAEATVAAVRDRKELIWVPGPMRIVMSGLRHVPRPLFRRLPI